MLKNKLREGSSTVSDVREHHIRMTAPKPLKCGMYISARMAADGLHRPHCGAPLTYISKGLQTLGRVGASDCIMCVETITSK